MAVVVTIETLGKSPRKRHLVFDFSDPRPNESRQEQARDGAAVEVLYERDSRPWVDRRYRYRSPGAFTAQERALAYIRMAPQLQRAREQLRAGPIPGERAMPRRDRE